MATIPTKGLVAVFLDTNIAGLVTQRRGRNTEADACDLWRSRLVAANISVFLPEIADYELRREFLRTKNVGAIERLNNFGQAAPGRFLAIETPALRDAARLWADVRNRGIPTAGKDALDGDAILAAQVMEWCRQTEVALSAVVVATTNVSDLSRFTDAGGVTLPAATWRDIPV